ncbi:MULTISPECIES: hypothetical protein [Pseudomonas]|uniref:hypothetical protein n=1 Tax=Pseudomonas TaxID=286 RepID=UPI000A8296F1|nr:MULTISPECIES: hypothetical protein [Pseudomonas]WHS57643.1 hypothetical protein QLH64_30280 [Pseudomonas brassicacearum]
MSMPIQQFPRLAHLEWPGLSDLSIPADVLAGTQRGVEICSSGLSDLPAPLNKASCWIYCREAWPHADPDFEGLVFVTLAVKADHRYAQLLPNHKHTEHGVFPGSVFTTDPLSLHWLAPNADNGVDFIGLQFEVPYHEADAFYDDLLHQLGELGAIRVSKPGVADALLVATGDYVGVPPGPLEAGMAHE